MTLWEWLAILAVLVPFLYILYIGADRAPVVDNARKMKNELEEIDRAISEAITRGERPADGIWHPEEFLPLLRDKYSRLREDGLDTFGNAYGPIPHGRRPTVPAATHQELAGIIDPTFWSPFEVEKLEGSDPPPPQLQPLP